MVTVTKFPFSGILPRIGVGVKPFPDSRSEASSTDFCAAKWRPCCTAAKVELRNVKDVSWQGGTQKRWRRFVVRWNSETSKTFRGKIELRKVSATELSQLVEKGFVCFQIDPPLALRRWAGGFRFITSTTDSQKQGARKKFWNERVPVRGLHPLHPQKFFEKNFTKNFTFDTKSNLIASDSPISSFSPGIPPRCTPPGLR